MSNLISEQLEKDLERIRHLEEEINKNKVENEQIMVILNDMGSKLNEIHKIVVG